MNTKLSKALLALGLVASLGAGAQVVDTNPHWGDAEFKQLRTGLTQDKVRSLIGKPSTVQVDSGTTQWHYRYTDISGYDAEVDVTFDASGHVTKIDPAPLRY